MTVRGKKIYVGLSGGVDSAVSAMLLKEAGASITGVFIKGWYPPGMPCTWAAERRDAMRVAARLGIPFLTLDAGAEYKKGVIDYLLKEYRAGRTPNPDIMCNRDVKFGAFYRFAKVHGADAIATGHYRSGEKDQSYFLWAVPNDILRESIFPVGKLDKSEVRSLANKHHLPVAEKKDSQGICFLGSISVEEFLQNEFGIHAGRAIDEQGRIVGEHKGVLLSTLGQRVALEGVTETGPWYVLTKDIPKNQLIVGKSRLLQNVEVQNRISFTHENWFSESRSTTSAQYRYRGPRISGHVKEDLFISTHMLPELVTPGQSIVFYDTNDELVGGGIIVP